MFIIRSLLKHFRGQYGLGRSFWIHGILGSLILAIITAICLSMALSYVIPILNSSDIGHKGVHPALIAMQTKQTIIIMVASILYFLSFIYVWTGVWRSASNHKTEWQKYLAQGFIFLLLLILVLKYYMF